jgi:predicted branched-subunit amino acid permease
MVDMWAPQLPVLEMIFAVMIINLRYLLIGASLNPLFQGASLTQKSTIMHLVADENWAVTMAAHRKGYATIWYLLGGGICLFTVWSFGTLFGHRLGALVRNPEALALDFAFTAVFTALAVSLWRGKSDLLPWAGAAILAITAEKLLPGKWYIVIGGIGGALLPLLRKEPDHERR